jgi:chloramphenicol-sensitive protein RarD
MIYSRRMKNRGMLVAILAYLIWGFLPAYWKLLKGVSALEILSHRIVWALVFNVLVLTMMKRWGWMQATLRNGKTMWVFLASTVLLSANWLTYIWAVNSGYVVESSLGYFILPLLNVGTGVLFFREKIRPGQWLAIAVALLGVLYLVLAQGGVLWISFTLAITFALYGVMRKTAALDSLEGLTLETAMVALPALVYLVYLEVNGVAAFAHVDWRTTLLLAFSGVATAVPLLLFASGVRQIPMSTIGILQYIAPVIQFALGAFVYHEPFSTARWVGFAIVWLALTVYTVERIWWQRRVVIVHPV